MKRKVLIWVIVAFMFCGVASAASLWGTFNGNQIIRLTVDGTPVKVSGDVPAISLNGRTMIPIYLLQEAGVKYSWDSKTQTVNIITPQPIEQVVEETPQVIIKRVSDFAKKLNGYAAILSYDDVGPYVKVSYNNTGDSQKDGSNLISLGALVSITTADEGLIFLYDSTGKTQLATFTIKKTDAEDYLYNKLTPQQFFDKWDRKYLVQVQPQLIPQSNTTEVNMAICSAIKRKYDKLKSDTAAEMNDRGILNSSIYDNEIKRLDEDMKLELQSNGCPAS